jgi:transcriptional regulator with XRE-family HTH domain
MRALRKKKAMTQEQLAERAGLDYKHVQLMESRNPPSPTLRTLSRVARALNVPAWKLIKP